MHKIKSKGFTLLEVLIAVFLASFVVLICASSLRTFIDSFRRSQGFSERFTNKTLALYLIYAQLQDIPNPSRVGIPIVFVKGTEDELSFVSKRAISNGTYPGIFLVNYRIKEGVLEERDRPVVKPSELKRELWEEEDEGWVPICKVGEGGFKYFNGKEWIDRWRGHGLPKAVSLPMEDGWDYIIPLTVGVEKKL